MDAQEVKQLLNERPEEFCRWLLPNGKRVGNYWYVGSLSGEEGDSLRVNLAGEYVGVWKDRGTDGGDAKGDLLGLLMQVRGTTNFVKSLHEAKEWLGVEITDDEDRLFRQRQRNRGHFETPSKCYAALNPDGPVLRYLCEERKIGLATLETFRVCQHKDRAFVGFAHFDENGKLRAIKFRDIAKRQGGSDKPQFTEPTGAALGLWGKWTVADTEREVVICEGEIDAMSVAELGFAAVSMPNGTEDLAWIQRDYRWLERFDSIIICYDNDKAGKTGLDKAFPVLVSRLGHHRCRIATLPEGLKDANEAVKAGRGGELFSALKAAESVDPRALRHASEYRGEVRDLFFPPDGLIPGIVLPWTDRLRLRPSEVTLWTGVSGHGKTTALLHCITHLTLAHGQRAIIASMEAPIKKSATILCRQAAGYLPTRETAFENIYSKVEENIWVYDYIGTAPWKDILETFRYAWRRYGVTQFVIDSIMTTDIDTDDYNQQSAFIAAICAFADETGGHVHVVAHSKKRGDETVPPGKFDVAGHANLTNRTFNGLTVFRNKAKIEALEDAHQGGDHEAIRQAEAIHDAELHCWKQRETGEEFVLQLWLHRGGLQFWPSACPPSKSYLNTPTQN
jgi:twinkle protein